MDALDNVVQELKGEMTGELRIGIIPTTAPDLLPLFLSKFASDFPKIKMIVQELTTLEIQKALKNRMLDVGILAIPLEDDELVELNLYSEPFLFYDCSTEKIKSTIAIQELDYSKLWLLEEGHCLRTQVQNICELSDKSQEKHVNIEFKAGSLDSLLRFTKATKGVTILPYLASFALSKSDQKKLIPFKFPTPVRSIGLVTHKHFVKKQLLNQLQAIIQQVILPLIPKNHSTKQFNPLS
jgi:LysR family hydrogen peroxide-inducible transcriptional activator